MSEFSLATVVLDCADARALADFYHRLLGWPIALAEPDWVLLRNPTRGTRSSGTLEMAGTALCPLVV